MSDGAAPPPQRPHTSAHAMAEVTGTVDFVVGDETFKTWYKVLGDLASDIRPLVILHGGPGIPHHAFLAHAALHKLHTIPIMWYDQLGCGASTHLPQKPASFWTPALFMNELANLLAHLKITHDFALLGHSWGGMLAAQFAAARQPAGLARLVVANAPASMALWEAAAAQLLAKLPRDVQDVVQRHRTAGTFDDAEYRAALHLYSKTYCCRLPAWPAPLVASLRDMEQDPTVCATMNGPDEFHTTGNLQGWDITGMLHTIAARTLVLNGRHDMAQDAAVAPFFERIPQVKWVTFAESSHMPCLEEPERYYEVVGRFLVAAP